jgi:Rrf2 family protein
MKISTRGRYALRVMIDLAINGKENYISLKDIANRQEISMKYLEQIVSILNKAGLVDTLRGNNGGYKLNRKPSEYRVGDILRVAEGDLTPVYCVHEECSRKKNCKTYSFWKGLDQVISDYVDSKTLDDLIK